MDAAVFSCVGVAPQGALLSRSFADAAAVARALSFSLSGAPEPPTGVAAGLGSATTTPFTHGAAGIGAPHPPTGSPSSSSSARCRQLGPAGGRRAGKRRPRPSKRAPTTYISTDAATFSLMVQRVTGADDEAGPRRDGGGPDDDHLGLGLLLPHFGVVGPLLPPYPAPAAAAARDAAASYAASLPPVSATEQQPLFPTLDSWNVMYGENEEAS